MSRGPRATLLDGTSLSLKRPDADQIDVRHIAHALSLQARYNGNTRLFYSVAEHSVHVSRLVPREVALQGLMHDAAEAYVGDVVMPVKALLEECAPGTWREIEGRVERAVCRRFDLPFPFDPRVKEADVVALVTERRDLLHPDAQWDGRFPEPDDEVIVPVGPAAAEAKFLRRYRTLTEDK